MINVSKQIKISNFEHDVICVNKQIKIHNSSKININMEQVIIDSKHDI